MVAAAFGRFSNHREWSNGSAAGAGIVFDLLSGADVVSGLSCPHDPRLVDGSWVVCNSAEQELVIADASAPLAVLFGELAPGHEPRARSRRLVLFALQVAGVPDLYVEEALWMSCAALESS